MTRSNNSSQSGYIKLQQESDIYEDEYIPWSDHDNSSKIIYTGPRYHQKRSLSESIYPRVNFQLSRNRMEDIPNENENDNAGNSSGNSSSDRADRNSAWSQFSKRLRRKIKDKRLDKTELEIYESVFKPVVTLQLPSKPPLTPNHEEPLTKQKFVEIVDSVKAAIVANIQPTRISQGSSGSYFCRNKGGKVVGVFKPKNEEPYGQLNPKWTKWIHRNLFPCFFGRSCLIPNLGYISESAASLLDRRLLLNIVPVTEVTWLSSSSFHYDYLDRRAARLKKNPKPLPDKIGSFQVFLNEYKDANIFLREHPWPESHSNSTATTTATNVIGHETKNRRLNALMCGRSGIDDDNGETPESYQLGRRFVWTPELQLQFREQFEKLVILDYLMRNTDRGFDNWMIKYCEKDEQTCRDTPPTSSVMKTPDVLTKDNVLTHSKNNETQDMPPPLSPDGSEPSSSISEPPLHSDNQDKLDNSLSTVSSPPSISSTTDFQQYKVSYPHIHVAAIDNGLAFPFKHPDQWRSYPYGWLYLSESLIGQPFTANTRNHFLPMLSNPKWWKETVNELRRLFALDADFEPGMFAKQMAVLKGQGWNIVEILKQPDQGPLDLCARQNVMVWDDVKIIEIPSEININNRTEGISTANDESDISSSIDGYFPAPPAPRRSLSEDNSGRTSLSTSAPSSSQRWRDKIKEKLEKFNFDSSGKNKDVEEKKTKRVIVERLEPVKGGTPFFTCC